MSPHAPSPSPDSHKAAISLSYDGATINHVETVLPLLIALGLPATFYAAAPDVLEAVPLWREAHRRGYEIGNGCLTMAACDDGSLPRWTAEMIRSEIEITEQLLSDLFGPARRSSFAYPWRSPSAVDLDYRNTIEEHYSIARSGVQGANSWSTCDLGYLNCFMADGWSGSDLVDYAQESEASGSWTIFAFAGVGVGERSVDAAAHEHFCRWLAHRQSDLWIKPVADVATKVNAARAVALKPA